MLTGVLIIVCLLLAAGVASLYWRYERLRQQCLRLTQATKTCLCTPEQVNDRIGQLRTRAGDPRTGADPLAPCFHARIDHTGWLLAQQRRDWGPVASRDLWVALDEIQSDLDRHAEGLSILPLKQAPFLCGFWSPIDDTVQPFWVALPPEYDPATAYPLAVQLHGQGMFRPFQGQARAMARMIAIAPHGRGGMDYKWIGEGDVLAAIDAAKRLFRIDPARIYCVGHSMGGTGAWHLATRFPDAFAAIVPCCGNTDIRVWADLWHWRTPAESPQARVRDFLRDDTSAVPYAENLRNVAITALQGEADPIVDRRHGEHMAEALRRAGNTSFRFHFLPLVTHGFSVDMDLALADLPRMTPPAAITYTTAWLKYDGSAWLRIRGIQERLRLARVEGQARGDRLMVRTENVSALLLLPEQAPLTGAVREIAIDGATATFDPRQPLAFQRAADGTWTQSGSEPQPQPFPPSKTPAIEGPLEHAFTSRFLLVRPTAPSATAEAARQACDSFAALWTQRFAAPPRGRDDRSVTAEDLADSNLILFGGPGDNTWTARVLPRLPVALDPDGTIRLGENAYRGPHAGIKLCYPNPENPQRYVVLMAGTTAESYRDIHARFGNWFDWIPYDARNHFDYALFDDQTVGRAPETFLTWGFFGESWEIRDRLRFDGVASWRSRSLPRVHPQYATPPAGQSRVYLDEVAALKERLPKEYLERNRSLDGDRLRLRGAEVARGLAHRFPGTIQFANPGYRRFRATVGIAWDGRTRPCEDRERFERAVFRVTGNAGVLLFESEEMRYDAAPATIEVTIEKHGEITLDVAGGRVWLNGTAVWGEARLE